MTPREAELLPFIRTRGHWEVVIRPAKFVQHRLERLELFELVAKASIDIRGWDLPHIDRHEQPHIDAEWTGQTVDWEHMRQLWRVYRSGQFVWISGIPHEWRDRSGVWRAQRDWEPNTVLGVSDTIGTLTEVFEFAARLSQTKVGDDAMVISIGLKRMENRLLVTDSWNRAPMRGGYRASVPEIRIERSTSRGELVARGRAMGIECAEEVFSFFGWKPAAQIVSDVQREVLERR
jgi:hypothetical protein